VPDPSSKESILFLWFRILSTASEGWKRKRPFFLDWTLLLAPYFGTNTQNQTGRQRAAIRLMHSRKTIVPYLIISQPLVDRDFVIITPNVYVCALVAGLSIVNITSIIAALNPSL